MISASYHVVSVLMFVMLVMSQHCTPVTSIAVMPGLDQLAPHLLLLICQLSLSCWHFVVKIVTDSTANILLFTMVRTALGTLLLLCNCKIQGIEIGIAKEDLPRFVFLGICCITGICGSIFALLFIPATK